MSTHPKEPQLLTKDQESALRGISYGIPYAEVAAHLDITEGDVELLVGEAIEALHSLSEL